MDVPPIETTKNFVPDMRGSTPEALITAALEWIEAHPDLHDQGVWSLIDAGDLQVGLASGTPCGSSACIAGWMAFMDGQQPHEGEGWTHLGAKGIYIMQWLQERLAVSSDWVEEFTHHRNTRTQLRAMVEDYIESRA